MKVFQCLSCGAPLNVAPGQRYVPCEFCGSTIDVGSRTVVPHPGATNVGGPAAARGPYPYPTGAPNRSGAKVAALVLAAVGGLFALGAAGAAFFFLSAGPTSGPT